MTTSGDIRLRTAVALSTTEQACTVAGEREPIPYATLFPAPRVDRVLPGHLVAIARMPGAAVADKIVWRWFDALVLAAEGDRVRLFEPLHGEILATPRDGSRHHRPGRRAYASAGLPGADWWVAGPVNEHPDVELDEVRAFYRALRGQRDGFDHGEGAAVARRGGLGRRRRAGDAGRVLGALQRGRDAGVPDAAGREHRHARVGAGGGPGRFGAHLGTTGRCGRGPSTGRRRSLPRASRAPRPDASTLHLTWDDR